MKIFLFITVFSLYTFSGVVLENLNTQYLNFSGEGDFSFLQIDEGSWSNQGYLLTYQNNELKIIIENEEYSLENIPTSIKEISSVSIKDLNFNNTVNEKTSLSVVSFKGESTESNLELKNIVLNCFEDKNHINFLEDIIRNCLNKGDLTESLILIDSPKSKTLFEDGFIKIRDGEIRIETDAEAGFIGKLKIKGTGVYNESNKVLTLKVKSARVGIFSIVGRLLNEMKKLESDFLKVNKDKKEIYLDISTLL